MITKLLIIKKLTCLIGKGIKKLGEKTKWKWDDRPCKVIGNILMYNPDLIKDVEKINKYGLKKYKEIKLKYKKNKNKTQAINSVYEAIMKSKNDTKINNVIKKVKKELKNASK